ncbi:MAG: nitroreductase family deazaflavin-dependent oxidoreductase [Candidatus Dormibacteraceae bacterium]
MANDTTPRFVQVFDRFVAPLIGRGVPFGPNALITVRGRKTGEPRTTPVAIVEVGNRRWIQGAFGEVNWVRNLRAAKEATLTQGKRHETVEAVELTKVEATAFFVDVLGPYLRRLPGPVQWIMPPLLGLSDVLNDPKAAADKHPVFELLAPVAN